MKTIRLLFNDAMARAIVEGRKTVTRRPVTPNANQRWWLKSASQITANFSSGTRMSGMASNCRTLSSSRQIARS